MAAAKPRWCPPQSRFALDRRNWTVCATALVIIGGFVVASSPPFARLIRALAAVPKTSRGAVGFVAFFAMATSLISWGLSLIFTGLLVREVTRRNAAALETALVPPRGDALRFFCWLLTWTLPYVAPAIP